MGVTVSVSAQSRRVIGIFTASALLAVAVLLALFSPDRPTALRGTGTATAQNEPAPARSGQPTASNSSPNPSGASTSGSSGIVEPGSTGPGITEPGIDLRFSARTDGGFDVAERIILRAPRDRVQ